jgi:type I restriction enzyme S subunit
MEKQMNTPQLRFPEFVDLWDNDTLDNLTERIGDGLHGTPEYVSQSDIYFINGNNLIDGRIQINETTKKVSIETFEQNDKKLNENTLLISINGTIGSIARYNSEKVMLGKSVGYFNFKENPDFYYYLLNTSNIQNYFISELTGSTIKNLSLKTLRETKVNFPKSPEQVKISYFLKTVDEKIQALKKKHSLLEHYKKGVMQKLFSQELRFKDEDGNEFPEWSPKKIGDSLDYEQPTNYLVSSTEYSDKHSTPVVTAGKTFILGYTDETAGIFSNDLPVIIFDDFTTATQFVDFPFKAKSSAMKILKAKENTDIKFMYEALQMVNYETGAHGRHWISVFAEMEILTPDYKEQIKISSFLSAIDKKINSVNTLLLQTENWKKGLLQKMFF